MLNFGCIENYTREDYDVMKLIALIGEIIGYAIMILIFSFIQQIHNDS